WENYSEFDRISVSQNVPDFRPFRFHVGQRHRPFSRTANGQATDSDDSVSGFEASPCKQRLRLYRTDAHCVLFENPIKSLGKSRTPDSGIRLKKMSEKKRCRNNVHPPWEPLRNHLALQKSGSDYTAGRELNGFRHFLHRLSFDSDDDRAHRGAVSSVASGTYETSLRQCINLERVRGGDSHVLLAVPALVGDRHSVSSFRKF